MVDAPTDLRKAPRAIAPGPFLILPRKRVCTHVNARKPRYGIKGTAIRMVPAELRSHSVMKNHQYDRELRYKRELF
jgi:hypothetical protein